MTKVAHFDWQTGRPHAGLPFDPPRMTREELKAAIAGTSSDGPAADATIEKIILAQHALAHFEARCDEDGVLAIGDRREIAERIIPLQGWFRQLGLFPVEQL